MRNNIKKTVAEFFLENMYFQHFMRFLYLLRKSDYYHLNVYITSSGLLHICAVTDMFYRSRAKFIKSSQIIPSSVSIL